MLVVDDEPLMAGMISRILRDEHQVTVAHSGEAAWQWLERGERFDGLICDLGLPAMSGFELLTRIRGAYPDLAARALFITGGAVTAEARQFVRSHPELCLDKPFGGEELKARLRAVCFTE